MKTKSSIAILSMAIIFAAAFADMPKAYAATSSLIGWAWSSNIGWISFNSANVDSGGGSYSVNIDTKTGAFSGYAWSSNIGWISFNPSDVTGPDGITGCPNGTCAPKVDLSTGAVTGWARIISDKDASGDGWIQLSGDKHSSPGDGVTLNTTTGAFSGYAWEPLEVGWLRFDTGSSGGNNNGVCIDNGEGNCGSSSGGGFNVSSCTADKTSVQAGDTVTFTIGVVGGTAPYSYSFEPDGTSGSTVTSTGNKISYTYNTVSSTGYSPLVYSVTDSSSPAKVTAQYGGCPKITVSNGNQSPLAMAISGSLSGAKNALDRQVSIDKTVGMSLSVRKGSTFALAWNNSLPEYSVDNPDGYICAKSVYRNNSIDTNWDSQWAGNVSANGSNGGLKTSDVKTGTYDFQIKCRTAGINQIVVQSDVKLEVYVSSGSEI